MTSRTAGAPSFPGPLARLSSDNFHAWRKKVFFSDRNIRNGMFGMWDQYLVIMSCRGLCSIRDRQYLDDTWTRDPNVGVWTGPGVLVPNPDLVPYVFLQR